MGTTLRRHAALPAAVALAAGIWLSAAVGPLLAAGALGAAGTVATAVLRRRDRALGSLAARAAILAVLGAWRMGGQPPPQPGPREAPDDGTVVLTGTMDLPPLEIEEVRNGFAARVVVFRLAIEGGGAVRVRCPAPLDRFRGGERVRAAGRLLPPLEPRNPGDREGTGTPLLVVRHPLHVTRLPREGLPGPAAILGSIRGRIARKVQELHSDATEGFVLAVLTGDRRLLPDAVSEPLLATGTYHLIAISGLHVAIVMFVVLRVPLPASTAAPLRLAFLAGFALLTGANPPVVRAALAFGLGEVLRLLRRVPTPLNVLAATAVIILGADPLLLFDVGCQLSFVAVAAILTWGRRLGEAEGLYDAGSDGDGPARRTSRRRSALRRALHISTATWAATAPLSVACFQRFPPLGPVWNLVASPLASIPLLGGAAAVILGHVHPALGLPAARTVDIVAGAILDLLRLAARMPGSAIYLPAPPPVLVVAAYAVLLAGFLPRRLPVLALGGALLAGACVWGGSAPRPAEILVLDAGDGYAAVVSVPRVGPFLVDAGGTGTDGRVGPYLARKLVAAGYRTFRAAFLTRTDAAHARGFDGVRARLDVGELWVSPLGWRTRRGLGISRRAKERGIPVREATRGMSLEVPSERFAISILHPDGKGVSVSPGSSATSGSDSPSGSDAPSASVASPRSEKDADGLALRILLDGKGVLLLGDLGPAGIARLLAGGDDLRSDVLIASGGSGLSPLWPEMRARARARAVVLTGAGTRAARELAATIERDGVPVRATWREGAIRIARDGDGRWRPESRSPGREAEGKGGVPGSELAGVQ